MAAGPNDGLYEFRNFTGLRNTVTSRDFDPGDLEVATNVDIDDKQRITRRKGFGAAVVAGSIKSLWSTGNFALAVRSETSLIRITPDYSYTTLRTDLAPGRFMSYTAPAARVYYSNGVNTGIVEGSASRSWGLAVPSRQPDAAAIGGVLPAGRYQYAVTYLRGDLQESGSPVPGVIELSAIGGISLSAIPASTDATVVAKSVYFSKNNGDMLYRAGVIPNSTTAFLYQMESPMQVPLTKAHLRPPPAGHIVDSLAGGRTLVAQDDELFYSEPSDLERFDLRKKFKFGSRLTMLAALEAGAFVGTENGVAWLPGYEAEKWDIAYHITYGVISGAYAVCSSDMVLEGSGSDPCVVFATTQGICLGLNSGSIVNLQQDRFLYPAQERGALLVRRHRGSIQAVAVLQGTETAANVSS